MENKNIDESRLTESKIFTETPYLKEGEVTPQHLLGFAKIILLVVAIILFLQRLANYLFMEMQFMRHVR